MSDEELKQLLILCQILALEGLNNGTYAIIPGLKIDILDQNVFLGLNNNPAIFVTQLTYDKLKNFHEDWIANRTIAIKQKYFLEEGRKPIDIIGVIVHEAGHAFNIYSGLPNTETNAYIFEIEILRKLFKKNVFIQQYGITQEDILDYYQSRMDQYKHGTPHCSYLRNLINDIQTNTYLQSSNQDLSCKIDQSKSHARIQMGLSFFNHKIKQPPDVSKDNPETLLLLETSKVGL